MGPSAVTPYRTSHHITGTPPAATREPEFTERKKGGEKPTVWKQRDLTRAFPKKTSCQILMRDMVQALVAIVFWVRLAG